MHHQYAYRQNKPHPHMSYPPQHYPQQYPPQNLPKQTSAFKSQAELGFELPPVKPGQPQQQQQQRTMPMAALPASMTSMQGIPRPLSMQAYPPPNHAHAPPPMVQTSRVPPQLPRSSSASPTRKPLPSPAGTTRPLTVTQNSGFIPFHPNRAQSVDLSALSRFNQERMAVGAINPNAIRNNNTIVQQPPPRQFSQYQQQHSPTPAHAPPPVAGRSHSSPFASPSAQSQSSSQALFPSTPSRRRASPPRFFGSGSGSRNSSPEKSHSEPFQPNNNPSISQPKVSPSQSTSVTSFVAQASPTASSSFTTTSSAALRQRNPIFDQQTPTTHTPSNTTTNSKFVPMWKQNTISALNKGGNPSDGGRGRSTVVATSTVTGRPLPQPTPTSSRISSQYTVEEPDDSEVNTSFGSETNVSEISTVSTTLSSTASERSRGSHGPGILDLRGGMPQPPNMNRAAATTGAIYQSSSGRAGSSNGSSATGTRSHFGERQVPQPPIMDRYRATTGGFPGTEVDEGVSMTLRFAKMGLGGEGKREIGNWPQDLPPLPKGPSSGFNNSFSRPSSSHSQSSNTSRHSHSYSQPQVQTQSAFAAIGSGHGGSSRGRTERALPNYDLDEPPPRPASANFSSRSTSPTGSTSSTASSMTGALERFRRNTQQHPIQPQPQHASYGGFNGRARSTERYSEHQTAYAEVKIESPKPLGGKEKIADVRKMESASNRTKAEARSLPQITLSKGQNDRLQREHRRQDIPKIAFGGQEDDDDEVSDGPLVRVPGAEQSPQIPRITFGDDDGVSSGPVIKVSNPDNGDMATSSQRIVFEVPGVGVTSQFGSGPSINVSGADDDDGVDSTPRRRGPSSSHSAAAAHHGGPRALPGMQGSQARSGASQMPGRGRGGLTCPACAKPIIGRIVGAMSMKWHPDCFRCTICDELLEFQSSYEGVGEDGIKRPYCHLDYHETFAPKCYHCKTAIVEERFISLNDPALGRRTYHEPHFFCAECGDPFLSPSSAAKHNRERDRGKGVGGGELAFSGDGSFSYDDDDDNVGFAVYKGHPYCEACHVRLRLPKCKRCRKPIRDHMEAVEALGGKWCWECFRCTECDEPFEDPSFFERDRKPYCENCFSIIIRNEI